MYSSSGVRFSFSSSGASHPPTYSLIVFFMGRRSKSPEEPKSSESAKESAKVGADGVGLRVRVASHSYMEVTSGVHMFFVLMSGMAAEDIHFALEQDSGILWVRLDAHRRDYTAIEDGLAAYRCRFPAPRPVMSGWNADRLEVTSAILDTKEMVMVYPLLAKTRIREFRDRSSARGTFVGSITGGSISSISENLVQQFRECPLKTLTKANSAETTTTTTINALPDEGGTSSLSSDDQSVVANKENRDADENEVEGEQRRVLPDELSRSVVTLSCESSAEGGNCDVYLVGTTHVSMVLTGVTLKCLVTLDV
ncbi:hypothetical protein OSB04_014232 [Centaurea solstitialis]|uniref:Uncharacterized protein n=1 Tax=Centaurea solstitialis TaxID=347529 RepID=A0AA38W7W1_9ASTR|nr:hypothetical protein OSB04_014232 [Centaurea solstitialis]